MPMRLRLQGAEVDLDQGTCSQVGDGFAAPLTRRSMLGEIQASLVFVRRALLAVQEWPIDQLDVDPTFLAGLNAVGDLNNLAGGFLGIGIRPVRDELHDVWIPSNSARANSSGCIVDRPSMPKTPDLQSFVASGKNGKQEEGSVS